MVWAVAFDFAFGMTSLSHSPIFEGDPFHLLDRLTRHPMIMRGESECGYWDEAAQECLAEEGHESMACSSRFEVDSDSWMCEALGISSSSPSVSHRRLLVFVMPSQPYAWVLLEPHPLKLWTYWSESHLKSNVVDKSGLRWLGPETISCGKVLMSKYGTPMRILAWGRVG